MITVNVDLPTDNNDVLAGTLLDPIPAEGGLLQTFVASTQRDGIFSITAPGNASAVRVPPILRANGMPDLNSDMPYTQAVNGGKAFLTYDEVTAGDAFATIVFTPRSEL